MAADLSIHVIPTEPVTGSMFDYNKPVGEREHRVTKMITEDVLAAFFSNTLGSSYFNLGAYDQHDRDVAYALISATPCVWVGEVSWLKAALFEDSEKYVPSVVGQISDLFVEETMLIDDAFIGQVEEIFKKAEIFKSVPNMMDYEVNDAEPILSFLTEHKGLRCFTVSW